MSGLAGIFAPGIDPDHYSIGDDLSAARLTPEARAALASADDIGRARAAGVLSKLWKDAYNASYGLINDAVDRGEFTKDEAHRIRTEVVNRALADAGFIEYVTSHDLPSHPVVDEMRARASSATQTTLNNEIPELAGHVPG